MNESTHLPPPLAPIRTHIEAGYPILYVLSWEEQRVETHLSLLAAALDPVRLFFTWTTTDGLSHGAQSTGTAQGDPLAALDFVLDYDAPAVFVLKDFHPFLSQRVDIVRRLRDCYQSLRQTQKTLIILAPKLVMPPELEKEITVLDYPLPDQGDRRRRVEELPARRDHRNRSPSPRRDLSCVSRIDLRRSRRHRA